MFILKEFHFMHVGCEGENNANGIQFSNHRVSQLKWVYSISFMIFFYFVHFNCIVLKKLSFPIHLYIKFCLFFFLRIHRCTFINIGRVLNAFKPMISHFSITGFFHVFIIFHLSIWSLFNLQVFQVSDKEYKCLDITFFFVLLIALHLYLELDISLCNLFFLLITFLLTIIQDWPFLKNNFSSSWSSPQLM